MFHHFDPVFQMRLTRPSLVQVSLSDISTFQNNAESGNCKRTQPAKRQLSPDSASLPSAFIGWLETRRRFLLAQLTE